ncbi:MAG: head GIN domain-containing protein [Bacteroidales bacterium]|jgi:hypothetical protein
MKLKMNLATFLLLLVLTGCEYGSVSIDPSENIINEEYTYDNFSGLDISSTFEVYVEFSDTEEKIVIEANENLHPYIKIFEEESKLNIMLEDNVNIRGRATLKAYITTSSLSGFSASGASVITVEDLIERSSVTIDLSGASYFTGELAVDNVNADLSGSSQVEISGVTGTFSVSASGASVTKDYGLSTDFLEADLSGSSNVYVTVNKEISISASGASTLYYMGQAAVTNENLSGASRIVKKN